MVVITLDRELVMSHLRSLSITQSIQPTGPRRVEAS